MAGLLGAGPLREEFSLPLAGDREMLELKLDTEDEEEDVLFLSVTLLL